MLTPLAWAITRICGIGHPQYLEIRRRKVISPRFLFLSISQILGLKTHLPTNLEANIMNTNQINFSKWEARDNVLKECLERFGSMNKNDYEVALFYLLLKYQYEDKSDYDISIAMRIPESKIKRLRYEVGLRYSEDFNAEQYPEKLETLLLNRKYRIHNDRIQFAISDKMFRLYLSDLLMKDGRFADTSFNVNIVSMTANDFLFLLSEINTDSKNIIEKMKKDFKDKETELSISIMDSLKDLAKEVVKAPIEKIATKGVADKLGIFTNLLYEKNKKAYTNKTNKK